MESVAKGFLLRLSDRFEGNLKRNLSSLAVAEANIQSAHKGIKTIYVTSCSRSEGKTTSAVHLAYALSTGGNRNVLLIDGNSHWPKIHELFDTHAAPGFTDLLLSNGGGRSSAEDSPEGRTAPGPPGVPEHESDDLFRPTVYRGLTVMTNGTEPPGDADILIENRLSAKLADLRDRYDFIIVDGQAVVESSYATVLANRFDGVILVIECEKTKWEIVQMAVDKIHKIGGTVLGVILNKRKYYIPRFLYGRI